MATSDTPSTTTTTKEAALPATDRDPGDDNVAIFDQLEELLEKLHTPRKEDSEQYAALYNNMLHDIENTAHGDYIRAMMTQKGLTTATTTTTTTIDDRKRHEPARSGGLDLSATTAIDDMEKAKDAAVEDEERSTTVVAAVKNTTVADGRAAVEEAVVAEEAVQIDAEVAEVESLAATADAAEEEEDQTVTTAAAAATEVADEDTEDTTLEKSEDVATPSPSPPSQQSVGGSRRGRYSPRARKDSVRQTRRACDATTVRTRRRHRFLRAPPVKNVDAVHVAADERSSSMGLRTLLRSQWGMES